MHIRTDILIWHIAIALIFGTFSFFLSKKTKIAPIVFLTIIGIALGPHFLKLLSPTDLGQSLRSIIFLGVAIILFEGGLTLDYSGYKKGTKPIVYLLSLGVFITWLVNAIFIYFLFGFNFSFSLFCSSLIIVTGPTVITPILRRININKKIFNILHWEGVLIDPIGVFLALLCFEIITSPGNVNKEAFFSLIIRLGTGIGLGSVFGFITINIIKKKWISPEMINTFTLSIAILTFIVCDYLSSESGLLGVIVCGFFIGIKKDKTIDEIKKFKLEITEMLIGIIFILLAANLNLSNLKLFGYPGLILLVLIILITRPLSVFLCTLKSDLKIREKIFISWISPRGIIVASMASLFYISLKDKPEFKNMVWFIEIFTFSVIIITVLFQGLSAGLVSKILKINQSEKEWVIVGIHELSIGLSNYLKKLNQEVILIDNNFQQVKLFKQKGYNCLHFNALSQDIFENQKFFSISHLIALTDNVELNALICQHWKVLIPSDNLYRWGKIENTPTSLGKVIWDNLKKPSIISNQIMEEEKEMSFTTKINLKKNDYSQRQILLLFYENKIVLTKDIQKKISNQPKLENALVLKKKITSSKPLKPQYISFYNSSPTIKKIVTEMSKKFSQINPHLPIEGIVKKIWKKINQESIYLGHHFALINIQNIKIKKNFNSICIAKNGINSFKGYDNLKIKIVFFFIHSINNSVNQINLFIKLSKIINNLENRKKFLQAKTKSEVLTIYK